MHKLAAVASDPPNQVFKKSLESSCVTTTLHNRGNASSSVVDSEFRSTMLMLNL